MFSNFQEEAITVKRLQTSILSENDSLHPLRTAEIWSVSAIRELWEKSVHRSTTLEIPNADPLANPHPHPFLLALSIAAVAQVNEFSAPVIGISDGDTIRVLHEGVSARIRLYGIDCPELRQPFGTTGPRFTGDLAFGKTVKVGSWTSTGTTASLPKSRSRTDSKVLNHELVRAGLAWWYRRYAKSDGELLRLQPEGQAAKRGIWGDSDSVPPWN